MTRWPALFCLSVLASAQSASPQPPPQVDQELRARVTELFQDFVDGRFREAQGLVADDSQDEYFASAKAAPKSFRITSVEYGSGFETALVKLAVARVMSFQGRSFEVPTEVPMSWKIEKGKWVWTTHGASSWATGMGQSKVDSTPAGTVPQVNVPRGLTQEKLLAAAQQIVQQSGFDKSEITLSADKPSSQKVVFHNGMQGGIHLEVPDASLPGLSVKADKLDLGASDDATIQISYDPPAGATTTSSMIRVIVIPFNQPYLVKVNLIKSGN